MSADCGAVIDGAVANQGVLTTPGYPQQYETGLYCVWTIRVSIALVTSSLSFSIYISFFSDSSLVPFSEEFSS